MNDNDALDVERQQLRRQMESASKFTPEWFGLKEQLAKHSIEKDLEDVDATEMLHSSAMHSEGDEEDHYFSEDDDDADDASHHVGQLIGGQLELIGSHEKRGEMEIDWIDLQNNAGWQSPKSTSSNNNNDDHDDNFDDYNLPPINIPPQIKRTNARQIVAQQMIENQISFHDGEEDDDDGVDESFRDPFDINDSIDHESQYDITAPFEIQRGGYSDDDDEYDSIGIDKDRVGFGRKKRYLMNQIMYREQIRLLIGMGALLISVVSVAMMVRSKKPRPINNVFPYDDNNSNGAKDNAVYGGGVDEPNPPDLPETMILFWPEDNLTADIQASLDGQSDPKITWETFATNTNTSIKSKAEGYPDYTHTTANHFSRKGTALLFAPGTYKNYNFEVGYYTSVIGLGRRPDDVTFTDCDKGPHVPALDKFTNRAPRGSGLDTFWRSIENIATEPRQGMQWTVSQAAPLRRMHVMSDLNLYDGDSWVSGGVAANIIVDGAVNFGGQQQWLMRNAELKGGAKNGAWSLVFVGCTGDVPDEQSGMEDGPSISVERSPNVRVEKPYIAIGSHLHFKLELRVPSPIFGENTNGAGFDDPDEDVRGFGGVKLAVPSTSSDHKKAAAENNEAMQKALDEGKDLVLSPGVYSLSHSLVVKFDNQVILGLGYATLVAPMKYDPCIKVQPGLAGVRIAGVMLEAAAFYHPPSSLLQWGDPDTNDPGDPLNPGVLTDVFVRVGGVNRYVATDAMMKLHSGNIYGDNIWLWRADHQKLRATEKPNFPDISLQYRQTKK